MAEIPKKIIWDDPTNDRVCVSHLDTRDKRPGETDDEFVARYTAKLKLNPYYANMTTTVVNKVDIPNTKADRLGWALNNGRVVVDGQRLTRKNGSRI